MATTKRQPTEHAKAAAMIRRTLKAAFPHTTFRVRSSSFAGGDAVDVRWTDGPTTKQVERLIDQHQYGHFDGMIDLYENSNIRRDIPQAKYVQTQRDMSRDAFLACVDLVNRRFGWSLVPHPEWNSITNESDGLRGNCSGWRSMEVLATFSSTPLVCPVGHPTYVDDAYCGECGAKLHEEDAA